MVKIIYKPVILEYGRNAIKERITGYAIKNINEGITENGLNNIMTVIL